MDPAQTYYLLEPIGTLTFELKAINLEATDDEQAREWAEAILRDKGRDETTYRIVCVTDHLTVRRLPGDVVFVNSQRP